MEISKKTLRNILMGAFACILLYWLLHETERVQSFFGIVRRIFSPFVVGAILAFIMNVPVRGFERMLSNVRKTSLRRLIAVFLTFFAFVFVMTIVFQLLIPQISQTIQSLIPEVINFFGRTEKAMRGFLDENPELLKWIRQNTELEKLDWSSLIQKAMTMISNSVATIANSAVNAIGNISSTIVNLMISLVFAIYCLFGKDSLACQGKKLLYAFLPERYADNIVRIMQLTNETFSSFISGQCLEAIILGCMFAVSMAIFKMPYIPLISVLIAVTALVPMVGAFVGCVLGAFFILVDDPALAVGFVAMFLILQQIEGNMIYPKVVGNSIGLPGMWVLLAVAVGGELMGISGMLLMIPVASVIYTLIREVTAKRLAVRQIESSKLEAVPIISASSCKEGSIRKSKKGILKKFCKK